MAYYFTHCNHHKLYRPIFHEELTKPVQNIQYMKNDFDFLKATSWNIRSAEMNV